MPKKPKSVATTAPTTDTWDPSDLCEASVSFLIERAIEEGVYAYDLETTGLNPRQHRIEGVAFYVPNEKMPDKKPVRAWFPFTDGSMDHTVDGEVISLRETLDQVKTMAELRKLWEIPNIISVRHNGIFDDAFLYCASGLDEPIIIKNVLADSMLADYVADERRKRYGLKIRVEEVFGHKMTTYGEAAGGQATFGFAHKKPLGAYACDDTAWTYRLWKWAINQIRQQDPPRQHKDSWCPPTDDSPGLYSDLEKVYWQIEMKIQRILMEMELTGCFIDWQWLVQVQQRLEKEKEEILAEIKSKAGWVPNLKSPKQVSDFLYKPAEQGGLGLPTEGVEYNKDLDQYETGDKAIKHQERRYPLVGKLLKYRSLSVLESSFCQKLISIAQQEGRVYARFRQTGTVIGRLSSADPVNLMNQPRDKDLIRKSFCSHLENDWDPERLELCLIDADYGQMELRMAAHLANEPNMIEVYRNTKGCANGAGGQPCERYLYHECKTCGECTLPAIKSGMNVCGKCHSPDIVHQARCRHVDLHQRTSEDVKVKRNPLAKCLDGSTLVLVSRGAEDMKARTIESVVGHITPGDHQALPDSLFVDRGVGGLQWAHVSSAIKRQNRPTKIVVTKRAVVIATNDHRFEVLGDGLGTLDQGTPGYLAVEGRSLVEAARLEKGMKLPVAKMGDAAIEGGDTWHRSTTPQSIRLNPFTKEIGDGPAEITLNTDWAYFAGIFQGDGCASGNSCIITHGHTEDYEPWRQVVRAACDKIGLPTALSSCKRQTRLGSRIVRRYLEGLDLCKEIGDSGEKTMRIPWWVLDGGPGIQWSYIAGLFDTDGTIGSKTAGTASVTTKYPEFAGQIAFLLRHLGMPVLVQPGFNKTYERWYYTIHVLGEGLDRFQRYCPLRHADKAVKLQERNEIIKRRCAPTDDEVLLVIDGGERTVYDFQIESEDHLYLQGGLIGHNNMNFGLLYRMGAPKFCIYAGLFDDEGKPRIEYGEELISKWHEAYPGIAAWHEQEIHNLLKNNYIAYSLTRRRRRLDIEYKKNEYRAGTQAIQFRVSGSCQDIIKLAMIRIYEARNAKLANSRPAEAKLWARFRFMIQVHDELVFECHKAIKEEARKLVQDTMEGAASGLRIPFVADARIGRTWDETH